MRLNSAFVLISCVCCAVFLTVVSIFLFPRLRKPLPDWAHASSSASEKQGKLFDKLPTGIVAPDFAIENLETGQRVQLKELLGKQPIVLIFGSLT